MVNFYHPQLFDGVKVEVKVRFFTVLREIIGKREEVFSLPDDETVTIETVLTLLSQKYGTAFTDYVYDPHSGQPRGFLQFLVNGASIQPLIGIRTPLNNRDVLAILPPVGGG
ncbi:MAG: MoaD/ThiS family protein [Betaproteobacteria bacterium]